MIGASLSRWTMSYFAAALVALITAEVMMAVGYGFPHAAVGAPETLILVHVVVIGWLSLLMCGALFQFLPVLLARPLHSDTLPLPALFLLIAGLVGLILGFVQLEGPVGPTLLYFALAGALLVAGFTLVLWNLGRTLLAAPTVPIPAIFVLVGLLGVTATATFGVIFALVLGGVGYAPFVSLMVMGLPLHVIAGLGGWLTFTAIGVSYRLLAMFMLAPELDRAGTKAALSLGSTALAVAIIGGVIAILLRGNLEVVLLAAGVIGLAAVALYGRDILHLYRARKRPRIELNSRMAVFAFASLTASVALIVILSAFEQLGNHIGAVIFLVAFGWLSGLGLSQLYKIVAFVTWLECYGPVLGKVQTPRVQDLVVEQRANRWFQLYFFAVCVGTAALIFGYSLVFQLSAAVMLIATSGIIAQLVRTRRLADVKAAASLPQGAHRPRLLFSDTHQA